MGTCIARSPHFCQFSFKSQTPFLKLFYFFLRPSFTRLFFHILDFSWHFLLTPTPFLPFIRYPTCAVLSPREGCVRLWGLNVLNILFQRLAFLRWRNKSSEKKGRQKANYRLKIIPGFPHTTRCTRLPRLGDKPDPEWLSPRWRCGD